MFASRVGFSGSADRMALFPVTSNPSWRQAAILVNFDWPYLRNNSFDPHARGHLCSSTAFLLELKFKNFSPNSNNPSLGVFVTQTDHVRPAKQVTYIHNTKAKYLLLEAASK